MERFKQIMFPFLFPGLAVVLISVPIAAALLIYTFCFGSEDGPVAYISYVFSAYSLTIVCAWIAKHAGSAKKHIQSAIHQNELAHRYLTDASL